MKLLTDEEYKRRMEELGLFEDIEYGRFFLDDMAFLMNLDDEAEELGDLIRFNNKGHLTYMSQALIDFSIRGAQLVIGPGVIDEYGTLKPKALYCCNYRALYSSKSDKSNKKIKQIK